MAAVAPEPPPALPQNRNLEYAKELLAKGRINDALAELETARLAPQNTRRIEAEILAVRADALLARTPPDAEGATDALREMLHVDPESGAIPMSDPARAALEQLRATQVVLLHERVLSARTGTPIRYRARPSDPQNKVSAVTLHYRPHDGATWSDEPMRRDVSGWSGYIRTPEAMAPDGADSWEIEYYLSARDSAGTVLDTNGSSVRPVVTKISPTGGSAPVAGLLAVREGPPPPPPAPPPKPTPFYKRWYVLAGGSVVVAALVGGTVYALTRPAPLAEPYLDQLNLP